MTNFYVGLMIITSTTVGKIILTSSAGTVISRYFGTLDSSIKGLSYIAMRVALPCLLFTNLCFAVTWEQLSKFYWAPLFGCVPMILGFLSSFLVRRLLSKEYRYVVILASTFQNALTFPVSILINLKGIEWFTGQAVADAQSYVFLYNIMCNIGLYSIGEPLVAWAKQTEVQEEEAELRRQRLIHMGATANEIAAFENRSFAYPFESPRQRSTQEALPDAQRRTAATTIAATAAVSASPGATENARGDGPGATRVVSPSLGRGQADCTAAGVTGDCAERRRLWQR
ncbi:putative transporter [Leptomonas pyrrhocoris]|uniref:Putative transporter n=1 Tax=Leptomonas pyrrhocoris TaxID=157538 RepID=A0A0N0DX96_LEPPY|nr:putative transporter [Leptomonas pyrrhocoris]KPA82728.1 putative transporter [Leptomonas pyrrhocoris]|eukprot:XP_015661167.1 putative transporter [Leptomonas pyrrhocoris]